jgi:hypothetical protein
MGSLSLCDVLVEATETPSIKFIVSTSRIEEIPTSSTPAPAPAPAPAPPSGSGLPLVPVETPAFFEKQQPSAGCGRHALNNLLGGLNFTKGAPNVTYKIDNPVKPVPLQSVCKLLQDNWTVGEPLTCPDDENYDTNILRAGLNLYGFPVEQTGELEWNIKFDDFGYVVNFGGGHWVALRKNDTNLVYINSVGGNSDGTAYINKQAFIDGVNEGRKTKNRISQILVVKKRTAVPIDPLETLKTGKLETEGDISSATSFESKKIILISKFNQLFEKKLDAELIVYINALLSTVDSVADADQFIQKR